MRIVLPTVRMAAFIAFGAAGLSALAGPALAGDPVPAFSDTGAVSLASPVHPDTVEKTAPGMESAMVAGEMAAALASGRTIEELHHSQRDRPRRD